MVPFLLSGHPYENSQSHHGSETSLHARYKSQKSYTGTGIINRIVQKKKENNTTGRLLKL